MTQNRYTLCKKISLRFSATFIIKHKLTDKMKITRVPCVNGDPINNRCIFIRALFCDHSSDMFTLSKNFKTHVLKGCRLSSLGVEAVYKDKYILNDL